MILRGKETVELWVKAQRSSTFKIIFTNGVFDLFTASHARIFAWIRDQYPEGRVIVALNDDRSVTRLKGKGRPYNTCDDRITVLNALLQVNAVTSFVEDTPEELLRVIKPDVIVKGGDYQDIKIAGTDYLLSYGGEVRIAPDFGEHGSDLVRRICQTEREQSFNGGNTE